MENDEFDPENQPFCRGNSSSNPQLITGVIWIYWMDQWLWMAYPLAMATKKWGKKKRISIGIGGSLSCTHIEMYWKLFIKGLTYFKYVQCMGDVEQCWTYWNTFEMFFWTRFGFFDIVCDLLCGKYHGIFKNICGKSGSIFSGNRI